MSDARPDEPNLQELQTKTHEERSRLAEEYAKGYMTGWRECYRACVDAIDEELGKP